MCWPDLFLAPGHRLIQRGGRLRSLGRGVAGQRLGARDQRRERGAEGGANAGGSATGQQRCCHVGWLAPAEAGWRRRGRRGPRPASRGTCRPLRRTQPGPGAPRRPLTLSLLHRAGHILLVCSGAQAGLLCCTVQVILFWYASELKPGYCAAPCRSFSSGTLRSSSRAMWTLSWWGVDRQRGSRRGCGSAWR